MNPLKEMYLCFRFINIKELRVHSRTTNCTTSLCISAFEKNATFFSVSFVVDGKEQTIQEYFFLFHLLLLCLYAYLPPSVCSTESKLLKRQGTDTKNGRRVKPPPHKHHDAAAAAALVATMHTSVLNCQLNRKMHEILCFSKICLVLLEKTGGGIN